ncbi:hypothetical protein [Mycobacterium riyadhense]|nr:hypothetical protein [Mycobacterium riyadhense]
MRQEQGRFGNVVDSGERLAVPAPTRGRLETGNGGCGTEGTGFVI